MHERHATACALNAGERSDDLATTRRRRRRPRRPGHSRWPGRRLDNLERAPPCVGGAHIWAADWTAAACYDKRKRTGWLGFSISVGLGDMGLIYECYLLGWAFLADRTRPRNPSSTAKTHFSGRAGLISGCKLKPEPGLNSTSGCKAKPEPGPRDKPGPARIDQPR